MFGLTGVIDANGTVIAWNNGRSWVRSPQTGPEPESSSQSAAVDLGAVFGSASPSPPPPNVASEESTGVTSEPKRPASVSPESNIVRIEGVWTDLLDNSPTTIQRVGGSATAFTATNPSNAWSPAAGDLEGSSVSMFGLQGALISNDTVISWSNGHEWVRLAPAPPSDAASSTAVDLGAAFGAPAQQARPPTATSGRDQPAEPTGHAAPASVAPADGFFGQWRDAESISTISAGPGAGFVVGALLQYLG
jgi:hypothetical protein